MGETCSTHGAIIYVHKTLPLHKSIAVKPEGKRQLGRSKHIWENNIKFDVKEIMCENVN